MIYGLVIETFLMDDDETRHRRQRLRELIDVCFNGEQVRLRQYIRNRTGKEPNQGEISGLIKRNNPARSFGDKKAKALSEQIGLHRRWFDMPLGSNLAREEWGAAEAVPARDKSHASSGNALDVLLSADAAETSQEVASPGRIEEKPAIDFSAVDAALNGVLALYGLTLDDYIAARSANGKPRSASSDFSVESVSRRTRGPAKKRPAHGRS